MRMQEKSEIESGACHRHAQFQDTNQERIGPVKIAGIVFAGETEHALHGRRSSAPEAVSSNFA
jgi:hypothetical protein